MAFWVEGLQLRVTTPGCCHKRYMYSHFVLIKIWTRIMHDTGFLSSLKNSKFTSVCYAFSHPSRDLYCVWVNKFHKVWTNSASTQEPRAFQKWCWKLPTFISSAGTPRVFVLLTVRLPLVSDSRCWPPSHSVLRRKFPELCSCSDIIHWWLRLKLMVWFGGRNMVTFWFHHSFHINFHQEVSHINFQFLGCLIRSTSCQPSVSRG